MAKNKKCACCGEYSLPAESVFAICPVCGWEDDEVQNENPSLQGGANEMSLEEAKQAFRSGKPVK